MQAYIQLQAHKTSALQQFCTPLQLSLKAAGLMGPLFFTRKSARVDTLWQLMPKCHFRTGKKQKQQEYLIIVGFEPTTFRFGI